MHGIRIALGCVLSVVVLSACGGGADSSASAGASSISSQSVASTAGSTSSAPTGSSSTSAPPATTTSSSTSNPAPKITGAPATSINVGQAYRFVPNASDANDDSLVFSISNKPSWASFDSTSGALTGTPQAADAATYSNIVISVSDGSTSTALAAFKLTVNQVATGVATLSWTPPTQNSDGSTLTTLAGYHVYYGTSQDNLDHKADVSNPGLATYVVDNLSTATWYFAMTSYTTDGIESDMSNVGSKTIN